MSVAAVHHGVRRAAVGALLGLALFAGAARTRAEPAPVPPGAAEPAATHPSIGLRVSQALRRAGIPDPLAVLLIATLPIVELRGAIPVGHVLRMDPWAVYLVAVAGNMIPIPFILLLLGPVSSFLMRWRIGKRFFEWLFARTRRKSAQIEKYEKLGLAIFVAIPLPVTGGWTGAVAAFLMGLRFWHAMASILLGVMIAGAIMSGLSALGWIGVAVAGVALAALVARGLLAARRRAGARESPVAGRELKPEGQ
ncbi:MAG: small multi-drug export protein [Kiritimatiellae bacterium]|nr:small multi-drug export protein [Kiritimatiellia bacterium]